MVFHGETNHVHQQLVAVDGKWCEVPMEIIYVIVRDVSDYVLKVDRKTAAFTGERLQGPTKTLTLAV